MPLIQKPALRDLYAHMIATQKVDLDQIVSIVGDRKTFGIVTRSSADVAAKIADGKLTAEQKLALAQSGLDAGERSDLHALLADHAFTTILDASSRNFLRAVLGLEPLLASVATPAVVTPAPAAVVEAPKVVVDTALPSYEAVTKLRELVKSRQLQPMYDAMIGAVDNPALKAEGEALFAKLPVVKPGMKADDFVMLGLWTTAPLGISEMQTSARYLPGRQVLCETTCYGKVPARSDVTYETQRKKIGSYDPNGVRGVVTYRATLVGEDPANKENFLVQVDGSDKPISVTKASIFKHNQPHELEPSYIKSDTVRELPYNWTSWKMDYADPLAKAKMCEIAIKMDEFVGKLDFTKEKVQQSGATVIGRTGMAEKMVDMQKKCVEAVFRSIDMKYPREDGQPFSDPGRAPSGNRDVARQAIKGTGMCVQQSTVFGGLLTPFMDMLGLDGQYRSGNCYRNIRGATENVYAPDYESGHGWWQVTFRPSMEMTVTDRTWNQVNLPLDNAYGFPYGDRYANTNITGFVPKKTTSTDVNVSGDISVQTLERQFSKVGDGRENHISLTQDNP